MIYKYVALIARAAENDKYYCDVPDLPGCITTGDSIEDAIAMITDAMSGWLVVAEDEGNEIPKPRKESDFEVCSGIIKK